MGFGCVYACHPYYSGVSEMFKCEWQEMWSSGNHDADNHSHFLIGSLLLHDPFLEANIWHQPQITVVNAACIMNYEQS